MLILSVLFEEIFSKKSCRDLLTLCCGFCFNEDCIFVGAYVLAAGVTADNDNAPKFFK